MLWSHLPHLAIVSDALNIPQYHVVLRTRELRCKERASRWLSTLLLGMFKARPVSINDGARSPKRLLGRHAEFCEHEIVLWSFESWATGPPSC